jgi:hypothetical protein
VLPASADVQEPLPIAVELLTPRSSLTDDVSVKFRIRTEGHGSQVVNLRDPSRVAVVRITVQPGARSPYTRTPGRSS